MSLNRLRSNKQRLKSYSVNLDSSERRARTRTLIQLGGLLNMIGFATYVGIDEGEDLQLDLTATDKAATLLGILLETFQDLPEAPDLEQLNTWKETGIRSLKSHYLTTIKQVP